MVPSSGVCCNESKEIVREPKDRDRFRKTIQELIIAETAMEQTPYIPD